ncbi:MAG: beta-ketoacyl-[acyl-carrier-protein] synthase family protein [Bryobacteraceae bacterium]|nr:beta-ketoacyl-[acyl-carrier-protein] synthase family protein [Bryobacteraceae bacterium]
MTARRVAVTGIGVFSACGKDTAGFWESLREGRSAIGPLDGFAGFRITTGAQIRDVAVEAHFSPKELDLYDRFTQYGLIAAREAVRNASVEWTQELRTMGGVVTGSCLGGKPTEDASFRQLYAAGNPRVPPMTIPKIMANAAASAITMEFGLTGPSFTFSTACSSASHAIAHAFWMVRQGMLEVAIAGGSEAPFSAGHLRAWEALRVVAPDTCRPFSRDRKGMALGEGAAMLVLEPMDHARSRGALILGEVVGAGMSADAHHITQPSPEGAARAMMLAMRDAGIGAGQIGYINAHGTGTTVNDVTESKAIRSLFGSHTGSLLVSSTKSMHGHALGAAGALEAAATVMALRDGVVPPTANHLGPDPNCDLDVCPNSARACAAEYALSNSFAFGGLNAVLAFRKA